MCCNEFAPIVVHWAGAVHRAALLTNREQDVFRALGYGLSNGQIAALMDITERTAKHHIAEIMNKLRLESRLQIGIVACLAQLHPDPCTCPDEAT